MANNVTKFYDPANLPASSGVRGFGSGKGSPRKIKDADELKLEFELYMDYRDANPFVTHQPTVVRGVVQHVKKKHKSPYSITDFCLFLDITTQTWGNWRRNHDDLKDMIAQIEEYIADHMLRGANAGVFNATLTSRILGIAERQIIEAEAPALPLPAAEVANTIHPDDPDPTGEDRPLYTLAQIQAGQPFHEPKK